MPEIEQQQQQDPEPDPFAGLKRSVENDDDAETAQDVRLSLTDPLPEFKDAPAEQAAPAPAAAAPVQKEEGTGAQETDQDVTDENTLTRVARLLNPEEPKGGSDAELERLRRQQVEDRRELERVRAEWQARSGLLDRIIAPQTKEEKPPSVLDTFGGPQMDRILREALASEDEGALAKVVAHMADKIAEERTRSGLEEVNRKITERDERDAQQADVAHRRAQIAFAIDKLEQRGGTSALLAKDLKQNGTRSYLWNAWHRRNEDGTLATPGITLDGQMMALSGAGLAEIMDELDNGFVEPPGGARTQPAGAAPAARPAATSTDAGTGVRPRATRRDPSAKTKQPTNDELADAAFENMKASLGKGGSSWLNSIGS